MVSAEIGAQQSLRSLHHASTVLTGRIRVHPCCLHSDMAAASSSNALLPKGSWARRAVDNMLDHNTKQMWNPRWVEECDNLDWSRVAPLKRPANGRALVLSKGTGVFDGGRKAVNKALKGGWFAYGWDHPPGEGRDEGCKGSCCPTLQMVNAADSDSEEDVAPGYNRPAGTDYGAQDNDSPAQWRFARAAIFRFLPEHTAAWGQPVARGAPATEAAPPGPAEALPTERSAPPGVHAQSACCLVGFLLAVSSTHV